jgi:hypothetical protein
MKISINHINKGVENLQRLAQKFVLTIHHLKIMFLFSRYDLSFEFRRSHQINFRLFPFHRDIRLFSMS